MKSMNQKSHFLRGGLFDYAQDWSNRLDWTNLLLVFIRFNRQAGANQIAVAVDVVDAGDRGPELAAAHPFGGEGGRFP